MSHYFIDNEASTEGNHEVHALGCKRMPSDKRYLGNYDFVCEAMVEARKEFWQSSSCERCAPTRVPGEDTIRARQLVMTVRQIV